MTWWVIANPRAGRGRHSPERVAALLAGMGIDASVHAYICCYSPIETGHFLALKRAEYASLMEREGFEGLLARIQAQIKDYERRP